MDVPDIGNLDRQMPWLGREVDTERRTSVCLEPGEKTLPDEA